MDKIALIPAAGRGTRMLSLTENNPKAMLPFNKKPIIGHQLDWLIKNNFEEVVIVVGYKYEKIISYVTKHYKDKIKIRFALQENLNGLAPAVLKGLEQIENRDIKSVFICLGDVIPIYPVNIVEDDVSYIAYGEVEDQERWCMVKTTNGDYSKISNFYDKPKEKVDTKNNIVGIYYFTDIVFLMRCIREVIDEGIKINGEYQLSSALEKYIEDVPIYGVPYFNYYDLGEINALNNSKKNISRYFNSISFIGDDVVLKSSTNIEKIKQEVNWYKEIPKVLEDYVPKLHRGFSLYNNEASYEMERVKSNSLQELYLYDLPTNIEWKNIFNSILLYFRKTLNIEKENIDEIREDLIKANYDMFIQKTKNRIEDLPEEFFKEDYYIINNKIYKNPLKHMDKIFTLLKLHMMYCSNIENYFAFLHGDFFFGNMMCEVDDNFKVDLKVFDPRGKYGKWINKGDIRYDLAKLNHSIYGYYDFIVNSLYTIDKNENIFDYNIYTGDLQYAQKCFDRVLNEIDVNKEEIDLLTGILFLTMIPLHSENKDNQTMQFIKAIEFLNRFL